MNFEAYNVNRQNVCHRIIQYMDNYEKFLPTLRKQTQNLTEHFFSATDLLENIK